MASLVGFRHRPRLSYVPVARGGVLHEPLVRLRALLLSGELDETAKQPFPNVVVGVKLSAAVADWSFDVFACSEDVLAKEMFIAWACWSCLASE